MRKPPVLEVEAMQYIHYGSNAFDPGRMRPLKNSWYKPEHGSCLWASPVNEQYDWKWFCDNCFPDKTDFNKSFTFTIREGSRIRLLYRKEDFESFPMYGNGIERFPDFEAVQREGYSAVWLTSRGLDIVQTFCECARPFYGWDCSSICVFDPGCIVVTR